MFQISIHFPEKGFNILNIQCATIILLMLFSDVVKVNGINPDPNAKCEVGNSTNKEVCGFYLAGCCRFGNFCRNLHVEAAPVSQSNDEEKMECGICLSLPLDGSYGLLSDCDCIFCLKCIRSWREESGPSTTRLCPLCRTQSFFVVPSPLSLKGERRMIAIETYKSSLKKIPCKVIFAFLTYI